MSDSLTRTQTNDSKDSICAVTSLAACLKDEACSVRSAATVALGHLGAAAAGAVAQYTQDTTLPNLKPR